MRFFTIMLAIALCPIFASAQKWSPVKVLLATGDTIRGEGILKYDSIRFRSGLGAHSLSYGPDLVKLVYIDDVIFASSEFIGLSAGERSALPDQFFMKVLLQGDLKLYYHEKKANRGSPVTFFIKKGDEPAFQLIRSITTETINGVEYRRVSDAYRTQLTNLFKDCLSVVVDSRKDYYKERPMLDLVSRYAECRHGQISYKQKDNAPKSQISLITGVDLATMNIDVHAKILPPSTYDIYPKSATSTKAFFGIQFAIGLGRKEKVSFLSELFYNQIAVSHTSHSNPALFPEYDITVNIQRSCLRLNEAIRRNFKLSNNLSANIHAGLSFAFVVSSQYDAQMTVTTPPNSAPPSTSDLSKNFQSTETGFFGGAGLNYKKFSLLLRYEQTLKFSANDDFGASVQNIYFGLGYRIK